MPPNGTQLRHSLRDAAVVVAIALAILALIEFSLRLVSPERIDRSAYELHPERLYSMRPGIAKEFVREEVNGGDVVVWRSNRDAFRGPELEPNYGGPTVIAYGDSNVQARFSSYEKTFTSLLQTELRQRSIADARVLNAGVVGYGPDQSFLRMRAEIDRYSPELVVLHLFADNDFGDLLRNQLVEVSDGGLEFRSPREDIARAVISQERSFRERIAGLLAVRYAQELVGVETRQPTEGGTGGTIDKLRYRERIRAVSAREFASYVAGGDPAVEDHYDIDIAIDPRSNAAQAKIRLMQAVLREAKSLTRTHGIELLVVIQPSTVDLTQNLDYLDYSDLEEFPDYDPTRLTSLLEQICQAEDIAYVNLFAPFAENDPSTLYFKGRDNHWNESGQQLAARLVAEAIAPLLPAPATQEAGGAAPGN